MNDQNVYNSGLNSEDWIALRDVIWPFIHSKEPSFDLLPKIPKHLEGHKMILMIKKYIQTKNDKYLDEAGQCLVPTDKSFGWYLVLTK